MEQVKSEDDGQQTALLSETGTLIDGFVPWVNERIWAGDLVVVFRAVSRAGAYTRRQFAVVDLVLREVEEFEYPQPDYAEMRISMEHAQKLMDQLWRAGVRPSDRHDTEPAMAAMREHIGDLRHVTFALLGGGDDAAK